jgi:hypothetical protein
MATWTGFGVPHKLVPCLRAQESNSSREGDCGQGAIIYVIEGMKLAKYEAEKLDEPLLKLFVQPLEPYLKSGLESMGLGKGVEIKRFNWDGDPFTNSQHVQDLSKDLKNEYVNLKGKKFIIVAHSWGCVLAILALCYEQSINPDLLITLGNPYSLASEVNVMQCGNCDKGNGSTWNYVEIQGFVSRRLSEVQAAFRDKPRREPSEFATLHKINWINIWAAGDMFSLPVKYPSVTNIRVEDLAKKVYGDDDKTYDYAGNDYPDCPSITGSYACVRNFKTTVVLHAVTTLNKDKMKMPVSRAVRWLRRVWWAIPGLLPDDLPDIGSNPSVPIYDTFGKAVADKVKECIQRTLCPPAPQAPQNLRITRCK